MGKKHFFSLKAIKPQKSNEGGSRTTVGLSEVSTLDGISLECLKLNKGSVEEPLWHPNAHKIGYCTEGSARISVLGPNFHDTFTVNEGDVFFIPKGNLHYIANNGKAENTIIFALSSHAPQELTLSKAIRSLSDSVFEATFHTPTKFFEDLKKSKTDTKSIINNSKIKPCPYISSRFKFNIQASNDYILTKGGYLKAATRDNLPIIEGLGIFTFGLNDKGIVEPHWHPNAGELIYIMKGHVKVTILSADGTVDVAELRAGDGGFAPASYFHSIENLGKDEADIIAFFNNPEPDYIGIGQAVGLCSNEVLASTFNLSEDFFNKFTPPTGALVIAGG